MPRGRLFPDEDNVNELILCNASEEVAAGAEITIVRELEVDALPFQPRRIDVAAPLDRRSPATSSERTPGGWLIAGLEIMRRPQFPDGGPPMPAEIFSPIATVPAHLFDRVEPGTRVVLRLINATPYHRRVCVRLIGHEIIPRGRN